MTEITGNMLSIVEIPNCCGTASPLQKPAEHRNSAEVTTKFHFALNVSNLENSVAFYSVLFDMAPAKHHPDYAKFELAEPPLVFSLMPHPPSAGGSLKHFGFPGGSKKEVDAAVARLAAAGWEITRQERTLCEGAAQDKVWVADPDRNFWEIHDVHEHADPGSVMTAVLTSTSKFHFSLNVADLDGAVDFYRILFGVEPVQHVADCAKFQVDDPPLVLALNPNPHSEGGALNHVGFRVANSEKLVAVQYRLEAGGIKTEREEGVECCYARQTKFWVPDADRNLWEIYTLEEDIDHSGFGGDGAGMPPKAETREESVVWEHTLISPVPERIPADDASMDEVRLEGTFNADLDAEVMRRFLKEIARVLKPGGRIAVHGLVSDRPFPGVPSLPGPAAMVRRIPVETMPLEELARAGFTDLRYEKLSDVQLFQVGGVKLRELRLIGFKPCERPMGSSQAVASG